MTTDNTLIEKREDLKRRLASGEYKTLVDVCFDWLDRSIRKITRNTEPLSIWYLTCFLFLTIYLLDLSFMVIMNEGYYLQEVINQAQLSTGIRALYFISLSILPIVSTPIIKQYIDRVLVFCQNELVEATESTASLDRIMFWLNKLCNRSLNVLVVVLGGALGGLYLIAQSSAAGFSFLPHSYSFTFSTIILNVFNWNIVYLLIMVIFLSITLRKYDLKLFNTDPAGSELITHLSEVLGFAVYFVAVFAALLTLAISLVGVLVPFSGALLVFFWTPLIILFTLNQTSLASIIRRAKWKTLSEIQSQVEELRSTGSLKDKETIEAINRLMDFHDRVKATRNSAIDSGTIINFINSLLLPLIAFLLGNLDKLLLLFSRKP